MSFTKNVGIVLLAAAMLVFQLLSCGGGSSGSGSDPITLSSEQLSPGQFVTINHTSINEGEDITVTFTGSDGYEVEAQAAMTGEGYARIAVPPFISFTSEDSGFSSGNVTVGISGTSETATLTIEALPDVSGYAVGEISADMITVCLELNETLKENLEAREDILGDDLATWIEKIDEQNSTLESYRSQLLNGTLTLGSGSNSYTFSEEEIRLMDKMIFAYYKGVSSCLSENTAAGAVTAFDNGSDFLKGLKQALVGAKKDAIGGAQALGSFITVTLAVAGTCAVAATAPAWATAAVAIGGITIIITAATSAGADISIDFIDAKSAEGTKILNNILDVIATGTASVMMSFAGGFEWAGATLLSIGSVIIDFTGIVSFVKDKTCASDTESTYCSSSELDIPLKLIQHTCTKELMSGGIGTYGVMIKGGKAPFTLTYKWGDGESDGETVSSSFSSLSHVYSDAGTYTITINVTDGTETASTQMEVEVAGELSLELVSAPSEISVGDSASFSVSVTGGVASYLVYFEWGDGTEDSTETNGTASSSHVYEESGTFTVTVTVFDNDMESASTQMEVEVTGELSLELVSAPSEISVGDSASFSVSVTGGMASYLVYFEWGDGTEDSTETNGTASSSHVYEESGTFTVTVTVFDGDMESVSLSTTVTVTEEYTGDGECADISGSWNVQQSMTMTCVEEGDDDPMTIPFSGSGVSVISQDGCTVTSQHFQGTVSGNVVTLDYKPTINGSSGQGVMSGVLNGNTMTLTGSGSVTADGLSCTDTSRVVFTR